VIFSEALDLGASRRSGYLDEKCAGDPGLRELVERLLGFAEASDSQVVGSVGVEGPLMGLAAADALEGEFTGRQIGAYRIVRRLGAGGMGVVYLAARSDGHFDQQVALKVVRGDLGSPDARARFERERQILSQLNHPNIARLLDGGVDEEGQPFYAMEFVAGEPLDTYCDRNRLTVVERLRLFTTVARAVLYAHRNLVVHRDLKPSNILVSAEGEIKLLDFGIAKWLDDDGLDADGLTRTEGRVMTPRYASPEQILAQPISVASDIYQLGLLLYELLTGSPAHTLEGENASGVERVVCDVEPVRPSTVVSRARAEVSEGRSAPPSRLKSQLVGDIDSIVMMALRKEPTRRYGSVSDFVDDIERHLDGLPVVARKPTLGYRSSRFLRRHWIGVGAAGLIVISVFGGLSAALWQARLAAEEAQRAEQANAFLIDIFEQADPNTAGGEELTVREVLEPGADRVRSDLSDQPEMQARMLASIGRILYQLGAYDSAERSLVEAVDLFEENTDPDSMELAESRAHLGEFLREIGRYEEAESLFRRVLETYQADAEVSPLAVAEVEEYLGLLLAETGDYEPAERYIRSSLATRREWLEADDLKIARSLGNLGLCLKWKGDLVAAEAPHREGLALWRRRHAGDHTEIAWSAERLAVLLGMRGDYEDSLPLHYEALSMLERLLDPDHPDIALILNNLAKTLMLDARYDEAEEIYRRALEINRSLFGEESARYATNLANLGLVLLEQGELDQALGLLESALGTRRRVLGDDHPYTALNAHYVGWALNRSGDLGRARGYHDEALEVGRRSWDEGSPFLAMALVGAGEHAYLAGKCGEAEPLLREAVAIRESTLTTGHWETEVARALLGICLYELGSEREAESSLAKARAVLSAVRPADDRYRQMAERTLGR